jgi:hypothetical protein
MCILHLSPILFNLSTYFSSTIIKPIPFIITFLQPIHLWKPKHHFSSTITQPLLYPSYSTSFNPYNHGYSLYTTCTHSILIVNKLFWSIWFSTTISSGLFKGTLIWEIFQCSPHTYIRFMLRFLKVFLALRLLLRLMPIMLCFKSNLDCYNTHKIKYINHNS